MSDKETITDDPEDGTSADMEEVQLRNKILAERSSTYDSQVSEPEDASVSKEEIAQEPPEEGEEPEGKGTISENPRNADDEPDGQRPEGEDKAKRLAGIVSARDREINKKNKRIRDLERQIAGFSKDKPEAPDLSSLDELTETYPDLMGGVTEMLKKQAAQIAALNKQLGSVSELTAERSREESNREEAVLAARMPDWQKTVSDNRLAFWAWVEDQPRADRELAYASQDTVADGEGLLDLITRFKTHLTGEVHPEPGSSEPESKRTNQRRLDGARTVPSRGSQAATTKARPDESDEVALRNKILAEREASRRI